jgi:hypothetical protein
MRQNARIAHRRDQETRVDRSTSNIALRIGRVTLAAFVVASTLVVATGTAARADGEIRVEAHSTYTVDPAAGAVHVVVDLTLTNQKPNSGGYIYFWSDWGIPMLTGATNISATRDGRSQSVRVEPSDNGEFAFGIVDLSPNLYYRDVARIEFRYDLPSGAPRTDATTRVNSAYAEFWAWPVGDNGLTSVRIRFPKAFDVEWLGNHLTEKNDGDHRLYESGAISDSNSWGVIVTGRNDRGLEGDRFRSGRHVIVVRAWPDDPQWARFVTSTSRRGLPRLERLVGLPWPSDDDLTITETISPYLYGYAGWYTSDDNTIEIGDELDPEVILHEISHIWFNDELFGDRWINEGFAQTYAALALDGSDGEVDDPKRPGRSAKGRQALIDWGNPSLREDDETRARELYGYNAAWYVIDTIADEIGPSAMRKVIVAADAKQLSFLGDPDAEVLKSDVEWERLLDLLVYVGGSKQAEGLFTDFVIDRSERDDLRDRKQAHRDYQRLVKRGGKWSVPRVVREELTRWDFDDAADAMDLSREILDLRDEIVETLDGTGVELPKEFETAYETADDEELDQVRKTAEDYLAAAADVAAAHEAVDADQGLFATIGLWNNDYAEDLDRADDRFQAGDSDKASVAANAVVATLDEADSVGQRRVGTAVGSLVGLLVIVFGLGFLVRRRRRRRTTRAADDAAAAEVRAAVLAAEVAAAVSRPTPPVASWGSPSTWAPPGPVVAPTPPSSPGDATPSEPPFPPPPTSQAGGEPILEPPHPA